MKHRRGVPDEIICRAYNVGGIEIDEPARLVRIIYARTEENGESEDRRFHHIVNARRKAAAYICDITGPVQLGEVSEPIGYDDGLIE